MADEPKKGDAAPLEGVVGPEIMMVLGIGMASMSLALCQNLALTAGQALEAPLLKTDLASIQSPVAAASRNMIAGGPGLSMPGIAPPTPKMGFG